MPMKMMCDKKMKNNLSLTLTTDDANQEKEINGFKPISNIQTDEWITKYPNR